MRFSTNYIPQTVRIKGTHGNIPSWELVENGTFVLIQTSQRPSPGSRMTMILGFSGAPTECHTAPEGGGGKRDASPTHLQRDVVLGDLLQHLGQQRLADVDQHVGVGAVADRQVQLLVLAAEVVVDRLLPRTPRHHVVVELTPLVTKRGGGEVTPLVTKRGGEKLHHW